MVKEVTIKVPDKADFDEALVNMMKFFLDTETKGKVYLYLTKKGMSTSKEIAKGANLYPSSVREALAELTKKKIVVRKKLEKEGAGKNPYVYEAIPPSELAKMKIKKIEERLNNLVDLDRHLKKGEKGEREIKHPKMPFRIKIERVKEEKINLSETLLYVS